MEHSEITWEVVPNTVANRMVDFSLTHKLTECRKMSRKTKAVNRIIKTHKSLQSYRQFAKLKSITLLKFPKDVENDDYFSFTEDEYNNGYKPKSHFSNYLRRTVRKKQSHLRKSKLNRKDNHDVSDTADCVAGDETLDEPSSEKTSLGQQEIKASLSLDGSLQQSSIENDSSCRSPTHPTSLDVRLSGDTNLPSPDRSQHLKRTPKKRKKSLDDWTLEVDKCIGNKKDALCKKSTNLSEMGEDNVRVQSSSATIEIDKKLPDGTIVTQNVTHSIGCLSPNKLKQELTPQVEHIDKLQDNETSSELFEISSSQTCCEPNVELNFSKTNVISEESTDFDEVSSIACDRTYQLKDHSIDEVQYPVCQNVYQAKDSGIEEDTEEDLLKCEMQQQKTVNSERSQTPLDTSIDSVSPNRHSNLLDFNNDPELKNLNESNKIDVIDKLQSLDESTDVKDTTKEMEQQKLQLKITSTEVVNKKYIIIVDELLLDKHTSSQQHKVKELCYDDAHQEETDCQDTKDTISPLSRKRLQRLRRLDLFVDSDSSDNEIEDACNDDTQNELNSSYNEHSSVMSDDNESEPLRCLDSTHDKKKAMNICNGGLQKNKQVNDLSVVKCTENTFHEKESRMLQSPTNLDCKADWNLTQKGNADNSSKECLEKRHTSAASSEKIVHTVRPSNLQELIESTCAKPLKAESTFLLEDLEEYDVFVMDIPTRVLKRHLVGKKLVLTKSKLKVGKTKYKVECRDDSYMSCVFASKMPQRPYQTVNIDAAARVVVRQRESSM